MKARVLKPGEAPPELYYEGRIAPLSKKTKGHEHRMRIISFNEDMWLTACADCGRWEVVKKGDR